MKTLNGIEKEPFSAFPDSRAPVEMGTDLDLSSSPDPSLLASGLQDLHLAGTGRWKGQGMELVPLELALLSPYLVDV